MSKTLVTKLNGYNAGNDYPVLGAIRIEMKGTDNLNGESISGVLDLKGSEFEWLGEGSLSNYYEGDTNHVAFSKTDKGLLLVKDKYNLESIVTNYTYAANVNFEDINKYCKNLRSLYISNTAQEGDLSEIADLNDLSKLSIGRSKVTGNISVLSCLPNLTNLNITGCKSVTLDLSSLSSSYNLSILDVRESNTTGNLSSLATCTKLKSLLTNGSGVKGSISSLANLESFIHFNDYSLPNTWSSSSLRPSNMQKIMGNIKFATSTEADNFIINMAECAVGDIKTWYFQNSHRTSASDAAVQKLQQQGYTLAQLITD